MAKERNIRNEKRKRENKMRKCEKHFAKNMENNNRKLEYQSLSRDVSNQSKTENDPKSTVKMCSACKSNTFVCLCNKRRSDPVRKNAAVSSNTIDII